MRPGPPRPIRRLVVFGRFRRSPRDSGSGRRLSTATAILNAPRPTAGNLCVGAQHRRGIEPGGPPRRPERGQATRDEETDDARATAQTMTAKLTAQKQVSTTETLARRTNRPSSFMIVNPPSNPSTVPALARRADSAYTILSTHDVLASIARR